ncbi:MAG: hypothetical protein JJT89_02740 [Nitriliruptoraceae bacterium]|nr:hypothetical protein [Nitriliruptoraceae bacterium]
MSTVTTMSVTLYMQWYDHVVRIEADGARTDLTRGLSAEVGDPLWMLARQWQLGEFAGEDAASPVRVHFTEHLTPMTLVAPGGAATDPDGPGGPDGVDDSYGPPTDAELDLRATPAEVPIEADPARWWTPGRRIRIGRAVAEAAGALPDDPELLLGDLPSAYASLEGRGYDGRALWEARDSLELEAELFDPRPPSEVDRWDATQLAYHADIDAGGATLHLDRHDGGPLDWFSVDADGPIALGDDGVRRSTLCSWLRHPGAPTERFWEIDEAGMDLGSEPPDRAHLATTLLLDLLSAHSDDWFTFSVDAAPGYVVTLEDLEVTDSFGDTWTLAPPDDGWSMFQVAGLAPGSLALWPAATGPLVGPVIDEVVFAVDEAEERVWAVERRIDGRAIATDPGTDEAPPGDATPPRRFRYRPATAAPEHWHPYVRDATPLAPAGRTLQGRLADLTDAARALTPAPRSDLLADAARGADDPFHALRPTAVPLTGLRLERRYRLARGTDGAPLLWSERRRSEGVDAPTLLLAHDVIDEATGSD